MRVAICRSDLEIGMENREELWVRKRSGDGESSKSVWTRASAWKKGRGREGDLVDSGWVNVRLWDIYHDMCGERPLGYWTLAPQDELILCLN